VVAADFSAVMLAQAQARGLEAEFWCVDLCGEIPGEAQFDRVVSGQFFEFAELRFIVGPGNQAGVQAISSASTPEFSKPR
jgi:hypothetical protein